MGRIFSCFMGIVQKSRQMRFRITIDNYDTMSLAREI
jgi:hypothetical protein